MPYVHRVAVAPADIDELDHASNVSYVRWIQDAAVAHSTAVGLDVAAYRARGAVFVVVRHEIDYRRPALLGDALDVETRVCAMGTATSERRTVIRRAEDGVELARAVTRWAHVDLARGRPTRIPDDVRTRFAIDPIP